MHCILERSLQNEDDSDKTYNPEVGMDEKANKKLQKQTEQFSGTALGTRPRGDIDVVDLSEDGPQSPQTSSPVKNKDKEEKSSNVLLEELNKDENWKIEYDSPVEE